MTSVSQPAGHSRIVADLIEHLVQTGVDLRLVTLEEFKREFTNAVRRQSGPPGPGRARDAAQVLDQVLEECGAGRPAREAVGQVQA
jgi:hypothetical protein